MYVRNLIEFLECGNFPINKNFVADWLLVYVCKHIWLYLYLWSNIDMITYKILKSLEKKDPTVDYLKM